ncbi:MAG: DUF4240 domain-containing protein [Myxococcota bacterium]
MDEDTFWQVVEAAKDHGAGFDDTFQGREEGLAIELRKLSAERIEAFEHRFREASSRAYSYEIWDAAILLGEGSCSDDWFVYFRSWLISLGRQRYEAALRDPETLADIEFGSGKEQSVFFEEFAYVAMRVFEEKTGREMKKSPNASSPRAPSGRRLTPEERRLRFPKLWKFMEPPM